MKKVPEGHNALDRSPYCGEPGALVSYLYNEGSPEELGAIAAHVQTCETCTMELAALGDTRELLSAWAPPQTELGFTLGTSSALPVSAATPVATPAPTPLLAAAVADVPWWRQSAPVWMQAVAATMVFAAGMAIGSSGRGTVLAPSGSVANTTSAAPGVSRTELAALEQRLRAELARPAPAVTTTQVAPVQAAARPDDDALMKRFRSLLSESEERQRSELALRTAQVLRDIEIQRKVDIATLQQNIGQIQGATGEQIRQNRELYQMLMNRASQPGPGR